MSPGTRKGRSLFDSAATPARDGMLDAAEEGEEEGKGGDECDGMSIRKFSARIPGDSSTEIVPEPSD